MSEEKTVRDPNSGEPSAKPIPGQKSSKNCCSMVVLLTMGILGFLLVLPCLLQCFYPVRGDTGRGRSWNYLHSIGIALNNYWATNGNLPPAVVYDKTGHPLYSWRVLLLPYVEQDALYKNFHLDEPWDSPNNLPLSQKTPSCYRSYGSDQGFTEFQVLIGPGTAFERPGLGLNSADFPDGLDNTILVVEAVDSVPWAKPIDLAYDPVGPLPQFKMWSYKPLKFLCSAFDSRTGFAPCFADGSVRYIRNSTKEELIRALITRNGGEKVDVLSLE